MDSLPTIKVRIAAHPKGETGENPVIELVSIEEIVNSQPAITSAVNDFIKRHRSQGIRTGKVSIVRV